MASLALRAASTRSRTRRALASETSTSLDAKVVELALRLSGTRDSSAGVVDRSTIKAEQLMSSMEFLEEIPIHVRSALQQLLGRFQAVRDGLPELLKNAKDQYARLGITERGERAIVV